jgi:hypothetical protein
MNKCLEDLSSVYEPRYDPSDGDYSWYKRNDWALDKDDLPSFLFSNLKGRRRYGGSHLHEYWTKEDAYIALNNAYGEYLASNLPPTSP